LTSPFSNKREYQYYLNKLKARKENGELLNEYLKENSIYKIPPRMSRSPLRHFVYIREKLIKTRSFES